MTADPTHAAAGPALTLALALAAGVMAQALARHLRIPGIVLLLATGVVLGPDLLGWVQPDLLGGGLQLLVGFAVSIILFEGGLNLNVRRLRRSARSIRQLVTFGAVVTAAGGAVAARLLMGWGWTPAVLFGSLVIVTGPTVVTPLLRRIRLRPKLATVLEAEGVLIDAIGAVLAIVTLEVMISGIAHDWDEGILHLGVRLGFGFVAGLVTGGVIALLLRFPALVPEGLENIVSLSLVLSAFQASNAFQPESGIVTVTVAGILVGNLKSHPLEGLKEFKEQLTVLLIGLLFVLLAADVRVAEIQALGWPGVWTVVALMLVVRPLNVLVGTLGADLTRREKLFLAWLAPRGIVAAAVSSLFAQELDRAGIPGGTELRALVFLVIAATVVVQGLTGGPLARLLGLQRKGDAGWAILGANPVSLALAAGLREAGDEVVFLDSNPGACAAAEAEGHRVLYGNAFSEPLLLRAELDSRAGVIGLTPNEEVNFLFAQRVRKEFRQPAVWVALRADSSRVTAEMLQRAGVRSLFGASRDVSRWIGRLRRGAATVETWERSAAPPADEPGSSLGPGADPTRSALPMLLQRKGRSRPYDGGAAPAPGDRLRVAIAEERRAEAEEWLADHGWRRLPDSLPAGPGSADLAHPADPA
ncbi:MAG: sodium:proton antiporter [Thermoanaerobaculia bacterium]|nr:sodium:proton antiporter [Thermoanaerobaculia bacterium]